VDEAFVARCLRTVQERGTTVTGIDQTGRHHLVVHSQGVVHRFPRKQAVCARIPELAERHRRAGDLGVGAPSVVAWHPGAPGTGHLTLQFRGGLTAEQLLPGASPAVMRRMSTSVRQVLTALRRADARAWPFPDQDWRLLWAGLPGRAMTLRGSWPEDELHQWLVAAEQAADVAATAPLGLVHGDLANVNALFSTEGELVAVLDWDQAVIGDPAIDTAAMLHGLPADLVSDLVRGSPEIRADLDRFACYVDTWALQAALWSREVRPPPPDAAAR
jgi:aminoglycoside phosphotransferase (APT) family kinase protein